MLFELIFLKFGQIIPKSCLLNWRMVGKTDEMDKPMYLRQLGVPFDALAYVFGRNPMYWYRIYLSWGRASIVGTTIKDPKKLHGHLVADEKHTLLAGKQYPHKVSNL